MSNTDEKKKRNKSWTQNAIIKEVKKKVKFGLNVDVIVALMQDEVSEKSINHSALADLCEQVVNDYPNYDLMQSIMRSKLIVNRNEKLDLYYILDPMMQDVDTINSNLLKGMFNNGVDFGSRTYTAEFQYTPNVYDRLFKVNGKWCFNTYLPPKWLEDKFYRDVEFDKLQNIPELYKKYLMHLTDGDVDSYEYILDWLSNMLKDRNYCILNDYW